MLYGDEGTTKSLWVLFGNRLAIKLCLTPCSLNFRHWVKRVRSRSFFSSYFPTFRLNTEIYSVNLCIRSQRRKRNRKNSEYGHFLRSENLLLIVPIALQLFDIFESNVHALVQLEYASDKINLGILLITLNIKAAWSLGQD